MNGIFKESTLLTIAKIKKGFLWAAVCLLIGGIAIAAIMVLMSIWNIGIGKILATMAVLTLVLFVGVNNFVRMEKGTKAVQILALIGLISGIAAAVVSILLIWEILPSVAYVTVDERYSFYDSITPSAWAKFLSVLGSISGACFWVSNVMSIKETVKVVKPLKITSVICESYCAIYAIAVVFSDYKITAANLNALSGLAGFAFIITALAAVIISKTSGKKIENTSNTPKTDAELRAEIEEQVRREMIEKEVRERMAAEMQPQPQPQPENGLSGQSVSDDVTVVDGENN